MLKDLIRGIKDSLSLREENEDLDIMTEALEPEEWNQITSAALMEQIIHGAKVFEEMKLFIGSHTPTNATMALGARFKHYNYLELLEQELELTPEQSKFLDECRKKSIVNGVTLVLGQTEYLASFSDIIDLTNDDIRMIDEAANDEKLDDDAKSTAFMFNESLKFIVYSNVLKNDKYQKYLKKHDKYLFKSIVVDEFYKMGIFTRLGASNEVEMCTEQECEKFIKDTNKKYGF